MVSNNGRRKDVAVFEVICAITILVPCCLLQPFVPSEGLILFYWISEKVCLSTSRMMPYTHRFSIGFPLFPAADSNKDVRLPHQWNRWQTHRSQSRQFFGSDPDLMVSDMCRATTSLAQWWTFLQARDQTSARLDKLRPRLMRTDVSFPTKVRKIDKSPGHAQTGSDIYREKFGCVVFVTSFRLPNVLLFDLYPSRLQMSRFQTCDGRVSKVMSSEYLIDPAWFYFLWEQFDDSMPTALLIRLYFDAWWEKSAANTLVYSGLIYCVAGWFCKNEL